MGEGSNRGTTGDTTPGGAEDLEQRLEQPAFYLPKLARVRSSSMMTGCDALISLEMEEGRPLGHQAGQFVQVSVFGIGEAPISVSSSPHQKESFELCVRAMGNVSRAVQNVSPGGWVGIRGPYGKGFPVEEMRGRDVLIVAGGIGLAPLRSLITHVRETRQDYGRVQLAIGAKHPSLILFGDEIEEWEADPKLEVTVTVDEPDSEWTGCTGVVTEPLKEFRVDPKETVAAVVGPPVMYKFVVRELLEKEIPEDRIFLSLERRFKCGIGKCGHCQLNDMYVCQDGPVFRYTDLVGRTEAIEAWAPERKQDA